MDPFGSSIIRLPHGGRVRAIAQAVVDTPAHLKIAEAAARAINRTAEGAFGALRFHLAMAYAYGYVQGWNMARERRGDAPPIPEPEAQA